MTDPAMLALADENLKDAEEFCKGAFGPYVSDVSAYTKIVAELMQHATDRATCSGAGEGAMREALVAARPFVDRAHVSHLGTDAVIAAWNKKCTALLNQIDAALSATPPQEKESER